MLLKTLQEGLRRQFWFHITEKNMPDVVLFKPRTKGENWGADEIGAPPKISVADTIAGCFAAVPYSRYNTDYHIYRTIKPVSASEADPNLIGDADITGEHWLLEPTKFKKVGIVTREQIKEHLPVHTEQTMDKRSQQNVIRSVNNLLKQ